MKRDRMKAWRFVHYAQNFIGVHYNYGTTETGGDDPVGGFDCSGLVTEAMRSNGMLRYNERLNAQMIYDRLVSEGCIEVREPQAGCLVFYKKPGAERIGHIGIMINENQVLEAGGGARDTHDEYDAAVRNAFVRIRPVHYRSDFLCYVDPFIIK